MESGPVQENKLLRACRDYIRKCEAGGAQTVNLGTFREAIAELELQFKSTPNQGVQEGKWTDERRDALKVLHDLCNAFEGEEITLYQMNKLNELAAILNGKRAPKPEGIEQGEKKGDLLDIIKAVDSGAPILIDKREPPSNLRSAEEILSKNEYDIHYYGGGRGHILSAMEEYATQFKAPEPLVEALEKIKEFILYDDNWYADGEANGEKRVIAIIDEALSNYKTGDRVS